MPDKCCVPGCKSNYNLPGKLISKDNVTVYHFPKDEKRKQLWLRKIPRKDFVVTKSSVVCIKHFVPKFVIRFSTSKRKTPGASPRLLKIPRLTDDAYPSIFFDETANCNIPAYLSDELRPERVSTPAKRQKKLDLLEQKQVDELCAQDEIRDLAHFKSEAATPPSPSWIFREDESKVSYWGVKYREDGSPYISVCIDISMDMTLKVKSTTKNIHTLQDIPCSRLSPYLDKGKLKSWTHWSMLLKNLMEKEIALSHKEQLMQACLILENLSKDESFSFPDSATFLKEQISLLSMKKNSYTPEMILWSFEVFSRNRNSYKFLRQTLTLPHPSVLFKLTVPFSMESGLQDSAVHEEYLRLKCSRLSERDRDSSLMLDEIHSACRVTFGGGKVHGKVQDGTEDATTAQVSIIPRLTSSYKGSEK